MAAQQLCVLVPRLHTAKAVMEDKHSPTSTLADVGLSCGHCSNWPEISQIDGARTVNMSAASMPYSSFAHDACAKSQKHPKSLQVRKAEHPPCLPARTLSA
eukprot:CAMPEP_0206275848 /NCGR_PEP_ID=MMETSP0047_2-20121206/35984_1 /ASSEMBLY_ACC=CAM_ASM_000192 /TAXON_ID=195065 /ORGANISM="Chroomonas mesostigmatica_cf, Strain CCMP1168" /LENGTH=100 /DNA_ID=CAMNT_0053705311 /DNA_START=111 /DNA_END=410 /DNA_ORIENTATION=+